MIHPVIEQELRDQLDQLPVEQQRQVVDYAKMLASNAGTASRPRGVAGASLLDFSQTIDAEDAARMIQAIQKDCRRIHQM